MILLISTLFFFPFSMHSPIGFIIKLLSDGKKKRALILALFAGLFYDLATNHLTFGLLTIVWIFSTCVVEAFRRLFFLNRLKELILGTLLFSFTLEVCQGILLGYFTASLSLQPIYEAFIASSLIWAIPVVRKFFRYRRLRSAHT